MPTNAATQVDALSRWCAALDQAYPPQDAEPWDQVGLHVGDPAADIVSGVLIALDVTPATLQEAEEVGADLLIVHHPLLFSPLTRLTPETAAGRLALRAARQGCAILAAHTNVDKALHGTSHPAADALDLRDLRPLQPHPPAQQALLKLVTFVPHEHASAVLAAAADAGAGQIGDYSGCAFIGAGAGVFTPGPQTSPHIGSPGQPTRVPEERIETVARRSDLPAVLAAVRQAHPYEEVPIDIYPLLDPSPPPPPSRGLGLTGSLPTPLALRDIARTLAERLPSPYLRLSADDANATAQTIAVVGGAGDSLIPQLLGPEGPLVDVLITGDLKHHPTLDARTMGLALIDAGHFATENPAMDSVLTRLESLREAHGLTAPIHRSRISTDPWTDWKTAT